MAPMKLDIAILLSILAVLINIPSIVLSSERPSSRPSAHPSSTPGKASNLPTRKPSLFPLSSNSPSNLPAFVSKIPSRRPSAHPTSPSAKVSPTRKPSQFPVNTKTPSRVPTRIPTRKVSVPSTSPSRYPSLLPTRKPSPSPSRPSRLPTRIPSSPSKTPTIRPSISPMKSLKSTLISSDPFTSKKAYHKTQVEPDSFSFGGTIVAATQSGRYFDGGSEGICWSTSSDFAKTWKSKCLKKLTLSNGGTYERASDPSVTYDAKHKVWMIAMLLFTDEYISAVGVSLSSDGLTWSAPPIIVTNFTGTLDKDWIVCDNSVRSPYYGNCYVQVDDYGEVTDSEEFVRTYMSTSSDGGLTWKTVKTDALCFAGQPLVTPSGLVIVPCSDGTIANICSFRSTNGGKSWTDFKTITTSTALIRNGNMRMDPLPSAEIDGSGRVYVAWQDCRFRPDQCSEQVSNYDIVYMTTLDGLSWTTPRRIPAYPTTSAYSSFIPGLAVDKATNGTKAHLALTYYYFDDGLCNTTNHQKCHLYVGFISSKNAGDSWSAPITISGPIDPSWAPPTSLGQMVGDYISTSFLSNGKAVPIFADGKTGDGMTFNMYLATVLGGIDI